MRDQRPLVIVAETVDGAALGTLVTNARHDTFKSVAVRAPGFGHRRLNNLQDIAALTGAEVIAKDSGMKLENTTIDRLGRARKVIVTEEETTILDGAGNAEAVNMRITQIRAELERAENERDRDHLKERLARLARRVAVIHVGAATAVELKEKTARTEGGLVGARVGPRRAHRAVRRHDRRGRDRCRQGDPLGAPERGLDRGAPAHHRGADRRGARSAAWGSDRARIRGP